MVCTYVSWSSYHVYGWIESSMFKFVNAEMTQKAKRARKKFGVI